METKSASNAIGRMISEPKFLNLLITVKIQ